MNKPHKHAELIKAWADGAEIEYRDRQNPWVPMPTHGDWEDFFEYRIKPEPKPDVIYYGVFDIDDVRSRKRIIDSCFSCMEDAGDDIKLTFDGETGKLKSAEVL